jgi:hypothetical protein
MSVPVRSGPELDSRAPRLVFDKSGVVDFDVASDAGRVLLIRDIAPTPLTRIVVELGGTAEIGRRTP